MEGSPVMATVLVKCPAVLNPSTIDYTLQISLTETVADLKFRLNRIHPCRPSRTDQRLVFRGQILNDAITIANMCEKENSNNLVVHMVLKSGRYNCPEDRSLEVSQELPQSVPNNGESTSMRMTETIIPTEMENNNRTLPNNSPVPTYLGTVNDQGQLVYTDLSHAVLFDGQQFYMVRGAALTPSTTMPLMMTASPHPEVPPAPVNVVPHQRLLDRVNFDFGALFSFLMRFGLVILIFAQGGNPWRIAMLCIFFGLVFLAQAGVLPLDLGARLVDRIWTVIMRARPQLVVPEFNNWWNGNIPPERRDRDVLGDQDALDDQHVQGAHPEHADHPERVDHPEHADHPEQPLLAQHQQQQNQHQQQNQQRQQHRNPVIKLIEIFTTFFLSMFPTEPPRPALD